MTPETDAIRWACSNSFSAEKFDAWLAAHDREIQAQALRDAADEWQTGGWANVPRRSDRVADRLGAAQHVCNWLRKRAAGSEAATTEEAPDAG